MAFAPPRPTPICWGFEVGVLRVAWSDGDPIDMAGRDGRLYPAEVTECRTRSRTLPGGDLRSALFGAIVRSPSGVLSKVIGVEAFCVANIGRGPIGLLLEPVEET